IIGFSALLNEENLSRDEIKDFTAMISQSGKRLIEIVNNVLDISKIQTGQIKITMTHLSVNSMFLDLHTFFLPLAQVKQIKLNYHNQENKFRTIYSDESKLHQVLTNLINNAIKFTKSGSIDFGFEITGHTITFYVKDTGIGIPPELHFRIFDRFIQAEQSLTKNYEGAGLGLAISKGLVELLGGRIWVESEKNKGTTFFFSLPNTINAAPVTPAKNRPEVHKKSIRGKILVAEDDWISFKYLSNLLLKSGATVIHAENGAVAVELVKNTQDISLILMDIKMPVMNGIEATKLIKLIRPDIPIIAQTAYAFTEEKNIILSTGCNEYLVKPIEPARLKGIINKYLKNTDGQ
ncbi:MAG: ATP-binding protein, partial [Bacteroidota bacterium]